MAPAEGPWGHLSTDGRPTQLGPPLAGTAQVLESLAGAIRQLSFLGKFDELPVLGAKLVSPALERGLGACDGELARGRCGVAMVAHTVGF